MGARGQHPPDGRAPDGTAPRGRAVGDPAPDDRVRRRLRVRGLVQGVGFRPFVNRLAASLALGGTVRNETGGVTIEVEGPAAAVADFARDLRLLAPPLAVIAAVAEEPLQPLGEREFTILPSAAGAASAATALIPPDVATCERCLAELRDPADRRHRYPFTNCTDCGPRYTIIAGVPYDRPLTTMAAFRMCPQCQAEYDDLASRRHHAQPNACPVCGPRLELADARGAPLATVPPADPLAEAIRRLAAGQIGAIKGLGGYHLACDAGNEAAVRRLRERKRRPDKPLAVMARDLEALAAFADAGPVERELLTAWRRPIVLLPARAAASWRSRTAASSPGSSPGDSTGNSPSPLAPSVSAASRQVGAMLPYTPLHHLLLEGPYPALVMTSGNRTDEPIACDDADAVARLGGIADFFLRHDRVIRQRADDSVARLSRGRPLLLRRSRGYVPEPVVLPAGCEGLPPVLAVGADLKNAACLTRDGLAFTTPYVGDLAHPDAASFLEEAIAHLMRLLGVKPALVVHDAHPDYVSTRVAEKLAAALGAPRLAVQHHHAHALACLAENGWTGPALALALDGHGWGPDGTIWGGELLRVEGLRWERLARLRPLPQPGGDVAAREPWRMGLAALAALASSQGISASPSATASAGPSAAPSTASPTAAGVRRLPPFAAAPPAAAELRRLPPFAAAPSATVAAVEKLIATPGACPLTSSAGRLFDAAAAIIGLRQTTTYEGQAAAELEDLAATEPGDLAAMEPGDLAATVGQGAPAAESSEMSAGAVASGAPDIDTRPLIRALATGALAGAPAAALARRFHDGLVALLAEACRRARAAAGLAAVALSGGVLQNRLIEEELSAALVEDGFTVLTHRHVSPNDGGVALGQAWAGMMAARR